jgi:hypothetical protein
VHPFGWPEVYAPDASERKGIMAKKKIEAAEEIDEIEGDVEGELDDELDGDLDEEIDVEGDDDVIDADEDDDELDTPTPAKVVEEDDDDVIDADEVEASLDVILKERLVVEDEPEDEEAPEVDDRGEGNERVLPKQDDEFVCNSCFLVKNANQLANKKKGLCRDCA